MCKMREAGAKVGRSLVTGPAGRSFAENGV